MRPAVAVSGYQVAAKLFRNNIFKILHNSFRFPVLRHWVHFWGAHTPAWFALLPHSSGAAGVTHQGLFQQHNYSAVDSCWFPSQSQESSDHGEKMRREMLLRPKDAKKLSLSCFTNQENSGGKLVILNIKTKYVILHVYSRL